jgi:hypothetical protein
VTPAEFERIAAYLAEVEEHLQSTLALARVMRAPESVIGSIEDSFRLLIAAHGQVQLELQHPERGDSEDSWQLPKA